MCGVCSEISDVVVTNRKNASAELRIGEWSSVMHKAACPTVIKLLDQLRAKAKAEIQPSDIFKLVKYQSMRDHNWKFYVIPALSGTDVARIGVIDVLGDGDDAETDVSVDEGWINLDRVRHWIADCDMHHSGACHSESDPWRKLDAPPELLLIDVERKCLTSPKQACPYVALSYCWGQIKDPFITIRPNVSVLSQEGAFDDTSIYARLPQTIRDSMLLTAKIGQKYLWIDRFCIIQDDPDHKRVQLNAMASIYANAFLTITARDGVDDTFGLRGIDKNGAPRASPFVQFDFGPACRMITNTIPETGGYHTRGWTFQEWVLSPRKLDFHSQTVSWNCRRRIRDENKALPKLLPEEFTHNTTYDDIFSQWPNIEAYSNLVSTYNVRKLTYPEDALAAFSAIIGVMSRSMEGGLLFGLAETFFDGTLLWQPKRPLKRRTDKEGNILHQFPSWSWLGWVGEIDTELWVEAHQFLDKESARPSYFTVYPTVDWYKRHSVSSVKIPILNTYYEKSWSSWETFSASSTASVLPDGWEFRWPVPITDRPMDMNQEPWSPIIEFSTYCLHLYLGKPSIRTGECVSVCLEDSQGTMVGVLLLNSDVWESSTTKQSCELISISEAEADADADPNLVDALFPEFTDPDLNMRRNSALLDKQHEGPGEREESNIYGFYNVLWIQRNRDVAYRVALGRVVREYWESAGPVKVDIRLA